MHKGPSGFAVAVWSDGHQIVSEIPNLMLEKAAAAKASAAKASAPKAAKAKAASKKKPAAVIKKPACRLDVQDDVQDDDGEESTPDVATDEDPAAEGEQAPAEAPAAIVPAEAPDAEAPDQPLEVLPEDRSLRKEYRTANNSMAFRMVWREKGEECKKQLFQLHGEHAQKTSFSKWDQKLSPGARLENVSPRFGNGEKRRSPACRLPCRRVGQVALRATNRQDEDDQPCSFAARKYFVRACFFGLHA